MYTGFSLRDANVLAHLLHSDDVPPSFLGHVGYEALHQFLSTFDGRYVSAGRVYQLAFRHATREATEQLERHRGISPQILSLLRDLFRSFDWFALLIPSGMTPKIDELLASREFFGELVKLAPDSPNLILQLDPLETRDAAMVFYDLFPAVRKAVNASTRWPGVLIWTRHGEALFVELFGGTQKVQADLTGLFTQLWRWGTGAPDLRAVKREYDKTSMPRARRTPCLHLIHMSDLHLGKKEADDRVPRVRALLRKLVKDLGDESSIVPVLTGDLMNEPDERAEHRVYDFLESLKDLRIHSPVVVPGNHDVRPKGLFKARFEFAFRMQNSEPVVWLNESEVGLIRVNSVGERKLGKKKWILAQGLIGDRELSRLANELDRYPERSAGYTLLALVHHHPIPVTEPDWYVREWYETNIGPWTYEASMSLLDADRFLEFCRAKRIVAVLHGHKHIPRAEAQQGIAIIGCGSTFGLIKSAHADRTFMSVNVITIDRAAGLIGIQLRAETFPGEGLNIIPPSPEPRSPRLEVISLRHARC